MRFLMLSVAARFKRLMPKSTSRKKKLKTHQTKTAKPVSLKADDWSEPYVDRRGVFISFDSPGDMSGYETSKRLKEHISTLNRTVTRVSVNGRILQVFAGNQLVARHHSKLSIADAVVTYTLVPALWLIRDITGKSLPPEILVVIDDVSFKKGETGWTVTIPPSVFYYTPSVA